MPKINGYHSSATPGQPTSSRGRDSGKSSWGDEVRRIGARGDGLPRPRGQGKKEALADYGSRALRDPAMSPAGAFGGLAPGDLIKKNEAPTAGDHSPSISSVNRLASKDLRILGRGAKPERGAKNLHEDDVPTLQFTTSAYTQGNGGHATTRDSAAHSTLTSLREMYGAGESHVHPNSDQLFDTTARAYSPYNDAGEVAKNGVRLPRVNVHAPNKRGLVLHRSDWGVDPMIGQQIINMSERLKPGQLMPGQRPPGQTGVKRKRK